MRTFLFLLSCLVVYAIFEVNNPISSAQTNFESNIQIIRPETENTLINEIILSPDTNYMLMLTSHILDGRLPGCDGFDASQFVLWHLNPMDNLENNTTTDVTNSLQVSGSNYLTLPPLAFSLDSSLLAIRYEKELVIYQFPQLERQAAFDIAVPLIDLSIGCNVNNSVGFFESEMIGIPQWSNGGRHVGLDVNGEVHIWNIQSNIEIWHSSVAVTFFSAIPDGWIILYETNQYDICNTDLSFCEPYDLEPGQQLGTVTANQFVLVNAQDRLTTNEESSRYSIVQISEDYNLTPYSAPSEIDAICQLSPFATYARVSVTNDLSCNTIWDIANSVLTLIPQLDHVTSSRFQWLPDGKHFVILDVQNLILLLYEIGDTNPVVVLNIGELPSFENWRNWIELEWFAIRGVSSDGRYIFVNLGYALLVVPIEYQQG
jgi:hypothetical protein